MSDSLFFQDAYAQEKQQEYSAVGFRSKRRNLRQLKQRGKTNALIDSKRHALLAGKRVSKNGKTYWETRKNRSDAKDSNV